MDRSPSNVGSTDKPADGTVTLQFPEHGKALVRAYGANVDVSLYLTDAYRVVQRDTGKSPMCFVAPFSDDSGQGTEITVVPSDQPAGAHYVG